MPDFAITGKKGNGKSLVSVARIREYLQKGLPVATNLDLNLKELLGKSHKTARVIRLPDMVRGEHLEMLGFGNKTPDESLNGAVVLDELATWLNARSYKETERQSLINWLVQARKWGWDCYYLVQETNMVDKQVREGLFEHVVQCRRMDRLTIPVLNTLTKFFFGKKCTLPRVHIGFVRYGDGGPSSLVVDRWVYRGDQFFSCYDTKQRFRADYPHGPYSYLPPWYTHGRHRSSLSLDNLMRITKILWRKYSRPALFLSGLTLSFLACLVFFFSSAEPVAVTEAVNTDMIDKLTGARIVSYASMPGRMPQHRLAFGEGQEITTAELLQMGYHLRDFNRNTLTIVKGGRSVVVTR